MPTSTAVGKTHFTVTWDDKYRGDGPVVGYVIKVREAIDTANTDTEGEGGALQDLELEEAWSVVGYVHVGTPLLEYQVTGRHANTVYHVMVVLAANTCGGPCGDGAGSPLSPGPILEIRTLEYGRSHTFLFLIAPLQCPPPPSHF